MTAGTLVIGAGLSGLAAAFELRRQGLPCTLIELRERAGGSFISEACDGFVLDAGPLAHEREPQNPLPDTPWPEDVFFALQQQEGGRLLYALHEGSEALIRSLTAGLPAGALLTRLAVSSLGPAGSGFAICLENGMVLTAPALILAVPAQQAGRMLFNLCPEAGAALRDFHHDSITRVSLGYRREDIPTPVPAPPDTGFAYCHWTAEESRVPAGHVLLQLGLRMVPPDAAPDRIISELQANMGWPATQRVARVHHWPGSHCLEVHEPMHAQRMAGLRAQLPPGLALVGSDYGPPVLEDRLRQARSAARDVAAWLRR